MYMSCVIVLFVAIYTFVYTLFCLNPSDLILIYMMVLCTQVNKMYVIATLSVYPHRASLKNMPGPPWPGIFFKLARCGYTLRVAITYINLICLYFLRRDFYINIIFF